MKVMESIAKEKLEKAEIDLKQLNDTNERKQRCY